jgi:hypothetical protein
MKPMMMMSIRGRIVNLDVTVNGYNLGLIDASGKYVRCFMHAETLSTFSSHFGYLKPNREVKIKCCNDYDIFGNEIFQVEQIFPLKVDAENE